MMTMNWSIFISGEVKERKGMSLNCFNMFVATTFSPYPACVHPKKSSGKVVSGMLDWGKVRTKYTISAERDLQLSSSPTTQLI